MGYLGAGIGKYTGHSLAAFRTGIGPIMSEPEKKEKPKKKKSTSKEGENLSVPENERKSSLTPERKGSEKESSSRKASTAEEPKSRKASSAEEPKSRKTSVASDGVEKKESKSRKSSEAAVKPVAEPEQDEDDEEELAEMPIMPEPDRQWDPNHVPFQAIAEAEAAIDVNKPVQYFQAPPETTKTDIQLLKDLDTRRLAELMEAFEMFDFDQDGVINEYDLRRTYASLGRPDVDDDEIKQMLSEGLNPLDFDAFVVLMGYKTLELDAEEVLADALAQWDYGTEGLISETRIQHDLMAFGDRFTPEEASAALEDAPLVVTKNKERMIDYLKFSSDLCGLRKRMKDYKPVGK